MTGDSGTGATQGVIAAMVITDQINGKEHKWEKIYDPGYILPSKAEIVFNSMVNGALKFVKKQIENIRSIKTSTEGKGRAVQHKLIKLNTALKDVGNE